MLKKLTTQLTTPRFTMLPAEYVCLIGYVRSAVWNSLLDYLRDWALSTETFTQHLKTVLSAMYTQYSA